MRKSLAALLLACTAAAPAVAQLSINFSQPGVSIGINMPVYPQLQRVPGYPVYYAPNAGTNFFFYDGLYWVYQGDRWYASSWYNGPWATVDPYDVPAYVLRVPVRYYRHAPAYFRGWQADAPPRWEQHWGHSWAERRGGWDRWDKRSAPAPAPLPTYQRQYSRDRYPDHSQQLAIQSRDYRYQPRETVSREAYGARDDHRGGPVRDDRGMPAHAKGYAKGHDADRGHGNGKPDKDKKDKKDKHDKD